MIGGGSSTRNSAVAGKAFCAYMIGRHSVCYEQRRSALQYGPDMMERAKLRPHRTHPSWKCDQSDPSQSAVEGRMPLFIDCYSGVACRKVEQVTQEGHMGRPRKDVLIKALYPSSQMGQKGKEGRKEAGSYEEKEEEEGEEGLLTTGNNKTPIKYNDKHI